MDTTQVYCVFRMNNILEYLLRDIPTNVCTFVETIYLSISPFSAAYCKICHNYLSQIFCHRFVLYITNCGMIIPIEVRLTYLARFFLILAYCTLLNYLNVTCIILSTV